MKLEYISHACVHIDTGDVKIATDPWFEGPAYCGQWYVFPKPVSTASLSKTDVVLISHGHEDHLHEASLRTLPRTARVLYPYNWYGGTREYIMGMGFSDVREAESFKTIRLSPKTSVTFISCGLDSVMVIESGGKVLVDVNDALHAMGEQVIDFYVRSILERWPQIDVVLCGFGGASYFPNTLHVHDKDDRAIGEVREQLFAHNFCRIISGLRPAVAVPFAADFALIAPQQRWINEVRFPRSLMGDYFREHFGKAAGGIVVQDMYPGDVLENGRIVQESPYRSQMVNGDLNHLIDSQYADEIAALSRRPMIPEQEAEKLGDAIRQNVTSRAPLADPVALSRLRFSITVTDVASRNNYNISFRDGTPLVERSEKPDPDAAIRVETRSPILLTSFGSEWGGDAITIGYGAEIHVRDRATVDSAVDSLCVSLLTQHPSEQRHLRRETFRGLKHMAYSPLLRSWLGNRLRGKRTTTTIYDRSVWVNRDKCEVCRVCDLPLLDSQFAAGL